jgi:hypothetical protein
MMQYPCGNLESFNYPNALRQLTPTNGDGLPMPNKIDLAAIDIYRDQERGIRYVLVISIKSIVCLFYLFFFANDE